VVKLLNKYFDVMVKEIIAQGGYIDKFIGDAIMAVFRGDFHLDRAIDAALNIRSKISGLPPAEIDGHFTPRVSIGINCGEVISGNIGSATLKRMDYTVIGDVVNTAQRLQALATENQILINDNAYGSVRESFNCRLVGEFKVKNKTLPQKVYEVLD
jgi:adenylate cyclase